MAKKKNTIVLLCIVFIGIFLLLFWDSIYKRIDISRFDVNNHETWFDTSERKVRVRDAKKVQEGMMFKDVVELIGRPKRDIGSGGFVMEWDLTDGEILRIVFLKTSSDSIEGNLRASIVEIVDDNKTFQ